ncbi:peptidoglycan D,D-transpeptidase FtsI family protein [Phaeacidiphilus oryzae]|uniref:peptidoglycan D,D-transpeptidase FtsI family protein n=1 Tax=Phaeacidiphilus oryzae TaxID=348818 RepID=UPI000AD822C5|nr:penicillin-binding protein 2 [Phaeacidiphilus oryzae]
MPGARQEKAGAGTVYRRGRPVAAAARLARAPRTVVLADPRKRLRAALIVFGLVLSLFVGRLAQLQFLDASALAADAAVNRYVEVALPAQRGSITDASGAVLAATVDAYDVTADPYYFSAAQAHVDDAPQRAAALLAPLLKVDAATLARKLTYDGPGDRYQLLARQVDPQTWNKIKALVVQEQTNAGTGSCLVQQNAAAKAGAAGRLTDPSCANLLAGLVPQDDPKRVYPEGGLASNLLGFVDSTGSGAGGLELQFQKELAGQPGKLHYAQSNGREVPTAGQQRQAPVPGTDYRLTIDQDIQWAAQQAISGEVAKAGAQSGYVVVQDVTTGKVLAMATAPGFDPNDLTHASAADLGNPALSDAYEPGSVSKLMTMAALLEQNAATPTTHVTVPGALPRAGRYFHDDVPHDTWHLTLNGVLAKSSNIGTILASEHLGRTQQQADAVLYSYLKKFGIGSPTGLGFPGETPGILAKPQNWNAAQQYTIPFGQGLSVNALQTTSVYSTIANGGVRIQPSLVEGSTGPDGRYVPAPAPARTRVVSEKTAKSLAEMLESVVSSEEGTGAAAQIPGYLVAGKTGTANRVDPQTGRYKGYTSSFIGFAPADRPRVTVSCVIQNPKNGHFGGQLCGPVFKKVMEFALQSLDVPPTGATPPNLPVDW